MIGTVGILLSVSDLETGHLIRAKLADARSFHGFKLASFGHFQLVSHHISLLSLILTLLFASHLLSSRVVCNARRLIDDLHVRRGAAL